MGVDLTGAAEFTMKSEAGDAPGVVGLVEGKPMDGIVAKDPRVAAILTAPEAYFEDARRKAWREAQADIAFDLDRRARRRRNGFDPDGAVQSTK